MKRPLRSSPGEARVVACPRETPVCLTQSNVLDSVGNTPLLRLRRASAETGCEVLAKAEFLNPGGSVKDRVAKYVVERAEAEGRLRPGMTILEVTSGNTGIALALVGAARGYPVTVVMPRSASEERRRMITSLGARLELLDDLLRIRDAVEETRVRARRDTSLFLPDQFANPDNAHCHERTTGAEILHQTRGRIDAFVAGVGTGGTVMGVLRALRGAGSEAMVLALEPDESAVMSGGAPGCHGIQGLADGFVPDLMRPAEVDGILRVSTDAARYEAARLGREEGLLVGISSGANVIGAVEAARRLGPGHTVVTILADRGERYLSLAGGAGAVPRAQSSAGTASSR
jgi:cysteine synthase A